MEFSWFGQIIPIAGTTDLFFAIAAAVITLALYLYPIPLFWRIWRKKSTVGLILQPCPLIVTPIACLVWFLYAIPTQDSSFVLYNFSLLVVHEVAVAICCLYSLVYRFNTAENNRLILESITFCMSILFYVVPTCLGLWFGSDYMPYSKRASFYGPIVVVLGIVMHASNLPAIVNAYRTKRTEDLPLGLCILLSLYAAAWFAYASYGPVPVKDHYVIITNCVGIILGVGQLFLCIVLLVKCRRDSGAANGDLGTPLLPA